MDEIESLNRKQLQNLCKKHGIKANGKNKEMKRRLSLIANTERRLSLLANTGSKDLNDEIEIDEKEMPRNESHEQDAAPTLDSVIDEMDEVVETADETLPDKASLDTADREATAECPGHKKIEEMSQIVTDSTHKKIEETMDSVNELMQNIQEVCDSANNLTNVEFTTMYGDVVKVLGFKFAVTGTSNFTLNFPKVYVKVDMHRNDIPLEQEVKQSCPTYKPTQKTPHKEALKDSKSTPGRVKNTVGRVEYAGQVSSATKSRIELRKSAGGAKKKPDFAKIHARQFANQKSLTTVYKRKLDGEDCSQSNKRSKIQDTMKPSVGVPSSPKPTSMKRARPMSETKSNRPRCKHPGSSHPTAGAVSPKPNSMKNKRPQSETKSNRPSTRTKNLVTKNASLASKKSSFGPVLGVVSGTVQPKSASQAPLSSSLKKSVTPVATRTSRDPGNPTTPLSAPVSAQKKPRSAGGSTGQTVASRPCTFMVKKSTKPLTMIQEFNLSSPKAKPKGFKFKPYTGKVPDCNFSSNVNEPLFSPTKQGMEGAKALRAPKGSGAPGKENVPRSKHRGQSPKQRQKMKKLISAKAQSEARKAQYLAESKKKKDANVLLKRDQVKRSKAAN